MAGTQLTSKYIRRRQESEDESALKMYHSQAKKWMVLLTFHGIPLSVKPFLFSGPWYCSVGPTAVHVCQGIVQCTFCCICWLVQTVSTIRRHLGPVGSASAHSLHMAWHSIAQHSPVQQSTALHNQSSAQHGTTHPGTA